MLQRPALPINEKKRLDALSALNILDTQSEERFDRLTRLAAKMFHVPIALVSLIDESRQWFKSREGLAVTETSREVSFCGHTILQDKPLVIKDVMSDLRFADNPLVTGEPHIRFYAGCQIKAPNGLSIGTLCIIDTKPKDFSDDDLESLQDLATMVERELAAIHLATIDDLTGISNRRGFSLQAEKTLHLCVNNTIPASLVFIDLNNFKRINDKYGHLVGNHALKTFAHIFKAAAGTSDNVARSGGDEFLALLPNAKEQHAVMFVEKLKKSINEFNVINSPQYKLSFAYGIAEFNPAKPMGLHELISESDRMMYKQKRSIAKESLQTEA
jgi:diguanylate cyclase (GGDEF)-like protein